MLEAVAAKKKGPVAMVHKSFDQVNGRVLLAPATTVACDCAAATAGAKIIAACMRATILVQCYDPGRAVGSEQHRVCLLGGSI